MDLGLQFPAALKFSAAKLESSSVFAKLQQSLFFPYWYLDFSCAFSASFQYVTVQTISGTGSLRVGANFLVSAHLKSLNVENRAR